MSDTGDPLEARKRLTFEQAEGAAPLPAQLKLKEVSPELRARVWAAIYASYNSNRTAWRSILQRKWIQRDHRMIDEFPRYDVEHIENTKSDLLTGDYTHFFGLLEWILRQWDCPGNLQRVLRTIFEKCHAAYTIVDDPPTIVRIASDAEAETLARAFADLSLSEFHGARTHLRTAGEELTAGNYAASVRESIHAVESVARVLEPSADTLGPALSKLERSSGMHGAMKAAFAALYGYTSDEKGIRHALLEGANAKVDEADALFMIGACAAFVSYMIGKARSAGLLNG